jgi:hypothetical protein
VPFEPAQGVDAGCWLDALHRGKPDIERSTEPVERRDWLDERVEKLGITYQTAGQHLAGVKHIEQDRAQGFVFELAPAEQGVASNL